MSRWAWLTRLLMQPTEDDQDQTDQLLEADAARRAAQRKLERAELMGPEVRGLASWARTLRAENHFSQRIVEAFGRTND